jgi:hypothetical protein
MGARTKKGFLRSHQKFFLASFFTFFFTGELYALGGRM